MRIQGGDLRRAFTLMDAMIVLAVVTLLAGLALPMAARAKAKRERIQCISRLKQIGIAFRIWAPASRDEFVMAVSTNRGGAYEPALAGEIAPVFDAMSNELSTPLILACSADSDRSPARYFSARTRSNISYFIGIDAFEDNPLSILAGDRNITNGGFVAPYILNLTTNSPVGWSSALHNCEGNLSLGDGSVQQITTAALRDAVRSTGMATNRILLP